MLSSKRAAKRPKRIRVEIAFSLERDQRLTSAELYDIFRGATDAILGPFECFYAGYVTSRVEQKRRKRAQKV